MRDGESIDCDRSLHFYNFDARVHVADGNGKIIGIHLHPHDLTERFVSPRRPVDNDPVLLAVRREKKWEPLNMIPMRVADENMDSDRL